MHYRAAPGLAGAACARRTISPLGVNGWIQQVNFILFGLLLIAWYIISATVVKGAKTIEVRFFVVLDRLFQDGFNL